jgi:hypothetical protein
MVAARAADAAARRRSTSARSAAALVSWLRFQKNQMTAIATTTRMTQINH